MQIVHFTPPELSRMLGVNESTVKRWIDRGLLNAVRTPGGHRRIREQDLQAFLAKQGQARTHSYILSRYAKHAALDGAWKKYFTLHRDRRAHEAREFLTACFVARNSILDILEHIVVPTLVAVGEGWRGGVLDIADEHRMTFLIRADLLALETLLPYPASGAPSVILACVPKENHELTLVLLSLLAREQGWQTTVLGINVPVREIERECSVSSPSAVVLAKVYRDAAGERYVRAVRSLPSMRGVPLYVGGRGWSKRERENIARLDTVTFLDTLGEFARELSGVPVRTGKARKKRTETIHT